jgi:hypothetical protein
LQLRDRDQWIGWDLPAEVLFSDPEIEVLQAYAKKDESPSRLGSAMLSAL